VAVPIFLEFGIFATGCYGLVWSAALEAGGVLVGEEVTVTLDLEYVKAA
jgi:hypothetical protein